MAPALALHRRQLQHGGDLAGGVHADVGEDQQVELVVADLLQHRLGIVGPQRQVAVGAQGCKPLAAGVFAVGDVVAEDLVAGIAGDALQPSQGPDRTVVVNQVGRDHPHPQGAGVGRIPLGQRLHEGIEAWPQDAIEDAGIELLQGAVVIHLIGQIEVGERPGVGVEQLPAGVLSGDALQEGIQLSGIVAPALTYLMHLLIRGVEHG